MSIRTQANCTESVEHEIAMRGHRAWAARNRDRIIAAWNDLPEPPPPAREQASEHLAAMSPERRAELEAEWADD